MLIMPINGKVIPDRYLSLKNYLLVAIFTKLFSECACDARYMLWYRIISNIVYVWYMLTTDLLRCLLS